MTSIISAVSGRVSRSLILGTLLPVALFVILHLVLVAPFWPSNLSPFKHFKDVGLGSQWKVITIVFLILVLSGLWSGLNRPIILFYEGYPWRNSPFGKWRTAHYSAKFQATNARLVGMRTLLRALNSSDRYSSQEIRLEWEKLGLTIDGELANNKNHVYEEIRDRWEQLTLYFNSEFPKDKGLILPTRLGNVIRSFEDYSYRQYRMEAVTLWPRLAAVLPKDYAAAIDNAKAAFDFMLNSSALLSLLALEMLIVRLPIGSPWDSIVSLGKWLLGALVLAAIAYEFYLGAAVQAKVWGDLFKGAFDLYRWDLLKQLGYARIPENMSEERAFWNNTYQLMVYGADSPTVRLAEYGTAAPFASGDPDFIGLETARSVSLPSTDGEPLGKRTTITILVRNADMRKRAVSNVAVIDTLPEGFDYEWGSERLEDNDEVEVTGGNPYTFRIGDLEPGKAKVLSYGAVRREGEQGLADETPGEGKPQDGSQQT